MAPPYMPPAPGPGYPPQQGQPQPWQGGGIGAFPPAGPTGGGVNAFQVYQSAVPVMEAARDKNIGDAMSTAGFTGNRFGSAAMGQAGQIGAQAAMQQNQLLANLLHGETQSTLDRQLQATGMGLQNEQFRNELMFRASQGDRDAMMMAAQLGLQAGGMMDQMTQDRLRMMQGLGQWETGRADDFWHVGREQFNQDRLGILPLIMGWGGGGGGGTPGGSPTQTMQPGRRGWGQDALQAAAIIASIWASDERLKEDIRRIGPEGDINAYDWEWKGTGVRGRGLMAQEVEKVIPEAVSINPLSGYKRIDYPMVAAVMVARENSRNAPEARR